ncbi:hypothetical protein MP228_004175 [Amoeboaphelidium protococcarum]|nr:hypothetical protein MP228_004175 [Amoeboaphelidium protococcarum]
MKCVKCDGKAKLKRPKTAEPYCDQCFFADFEQEIHDTIVRNEIFSRGKSYVIGMSGGKDSTVLAYVLDKLNREHDYGVNLLLVAVDEGITGYRDDSLESVKRNQERLQLPLKIVSYSELYEGWTMDKIVQQIGLKNNCTFCGVFRRQALEKGAILFAEQLNDTVDGIITGHNADDMAETVLMNIFRGDVTRLQKCTHISTNVEANSSTIRRIKPLKYAYEKEIVLYAHYKQLDYFSTECIYSPNAFRGNARTFLKDLERIRPTAILDIIRSGEQMEQMLIANQKMHLKSSDGSKSAPVSKLRTCSRCGMIASNEVCKACMLLESLRNGQ